MLFQIFIGETIFANRILYLNKFGVPVIVSQQESSHLRTSLKDWFLCGIVT